MSLVLEISLAWRFVDCRLLSDCDFLTHSDCSSVSLFHSAPCSDYVHAPVNALIVSAGYTETCTDIHVGRIVGTSIAIFYVIKLKDTFNFDKPFQSTF